MKKPVPVLIIAFLAVMFTVQASLFWVKKIAADPIATHNMLVLGEKTIYLSHLPMFQEANMALMPHRYQAILEVELEQPGINAGNAYMKDRKTHKSTSIYTINPEPFVLTALVLPGAQAGKRTAFKGTIFRGHLEKGGTSILQDLTVNVKRVVYFQQFDAAAKRPAQLEYLLFGKGDELFLAHLITAPPDFDQVISVKINHSFTDEELARGIKLVFPGTTNAAASRLKEKRQAAASFTTGGNVTAQKINITVTREFYFEEGELRTPPKFETTAEEKKSGFM